jgi:hypothetical protein
MQADEYDSVIMNVLLFNVAVNSESPQFTDMTHKLFVDESVKIVKIAKLN